MSQNTTADIRSESLKHLYVVNKQAKRARGVDKTILYALKDAIIRELADEVARIERHGRPRIDGGPSLCVEFVDEQGGRWSFHTAQETLSDVAYEIDDERDLEGFEKGEEYERTGSRGSLKEALLYFRDGFGINANDLHPDMPGTHKTFRKYLRDAECSEDGCNFKGTQFEVAVHADAHATSQEVRD